MNFLESTQKAYRDAFTKKNCSQHLCFHHIFGRRIDSLLGDFVFVLPFFHTSNCFFLYAKWLLFMNIKKKKITKTKVLQLFFFLHSLCMLFLFLLTWNGPATPVLQGFFFLKQCREWNFREKKKVWSSIMQSAVCLGWAEWNERMAF